MKKQTLFFGTALLSISVLLTGLTANARPYPHDFVFSDAQGDGDPTELTAADLNGTDTDTALLTAEGDFIVPTYLLPTQTQPQSMPVMTVSQTIETPEMPLYQTTVKQTPVAVKSGRLVTPVAVPTKSAPIAQVPPTQTPKVSGTIEKKPLLLPLAPIIEDDITDSTDNLVKERRVVPSGLADTLLDNLERNEASDFLLPHEIKVSFYKNATALSGQTLKWIKAFALQTIRDPRRIVEIRISQENPAIQAKRLAIIKNALLGTGLSTHQILVSYTKRPADSFVIRAANKNENIDIEHQTTASGRTIEKRTIRW